MSNSDVRFSPTVRRVIVLSHDDNGAVARTVIYEKRDKKKRQSKTIEPIEMFIRRAADGTARCAESYVARHRESNKKRRDGWVRDLNDNMMQAGRKGVKRVKLTRMMSM